MGQIQNSSPNYTDLNLDFFPMPTTHDVSMVTGDQAIQRSIRNLIFTNFYERPFQPQIGSGVLALLFENNLPIVSILLQNAIQAVITNWEDRVTLVSVIVTDDYDSNGFSVDLEYIINANQTAIVTSLFLKRVR